MSEHDSANNGKKPRATYSPLILLAIGIGFYAYHNVKNKGPETIPDLELTQAASAQTLEPAATETEETAATEPDAEENQTAEPTAEETETKAAETEEDAPTATSADEALAAMIKPRTLGSDDAPVKIVEHASFTCPHCAHFHETSYKQLIKDYVDTGKAQFIFVDFPLNRPAMDASLISRCIPEKNYFNFVHLLFDTQKDWAISDDYRKSLKQHAMIAGLSPEAFETCLGNEDLQKGIAEQAQKAMNDQKINSVPTLVINGTEIVPGNARYEEIQKVIDALLPAEEKK